MFVVYFGCALHWSGRDLQVAVSQIRVLFLVPPRDSLGLQHS